MVLGVPGKRLKCMQGQKTLSLSYNMHLFLPQQLVSDWLNEYVFQTPPLHDTNLRWLVDFIKSCVFELFNAPKASPSGKEWICIFIQTNAKIEFSQVCVHNKWAGLGFVLKTTRFTDSESTLSFERQSLYTRCTFRCKTLRDVFIHLHLCYALHESSFSKLHNRGTLNI